MSTSDPQFIYMILVLPSLFGLTLIGDGLNKIIRDEAGGIISVTFGMIFIGAVVFAFFFFSTYFKAAT